MRNVHEYSVDRATSTAKIGSTNPIRKYLDADRRRSSSSFPTGAELLRPGWTAHADRRCPRGHPRLAEEGAAPPGNESPEQVLRFCPFCPEDQNAIASGRYETHLEEHIRKGALSAREVAEEPESFTADAGQVARAATRKAPAKRAGRKAKK